jgi:hypothetical protein
LLQDLQPDIPQLLPTETTTEIRMFHNRYHLTILTPLASPSIQQYSEMN